MPTISLRSALLLDAVASGATGLLGLLAAGPLGDLLNLPPALLRVAGGLLVPFVTFLVVLATRDVVSRRGAVTVIALNLAWVAGSVVVLVSGEFDPNALGYAFVIAQAAAVAIFAGLQATALGREGRVNAAPA